tara:strand:+ start:3761 stop:4399 length:639 start_codon:yes stop_codon:yes gene_type:complete
MNKLSFVKINTRSKYLLVACTVLFFTACAETRVITLEESVQQQYNLTDYDSDGVISAREKCPETRIGASIDNYGCGSKIAQIKPFKIAINFANNSYELPMHAHDEVSKLAEFLKNYPEVNIIIEGHSSNVGTAKLNQALSNERAKAIALMLVNDFKISENRVSSIGYGFERLKDKGDSEQAHAVNRRIMAEVSHTEHIDELKWTIYTVDQAN